MTAITGGNKKRSKRCQTSNIALGIAGSSLRKEVLLTCQAANIAIKSPPTGSRQNAQHPKAGDTGYRD